MSDRSHSHIQVLRRWYLRLLSAAFIACVATAAPALSPTVCIAAEPLHAGTLRAPVAHVGHYHILSCGSTSVVLDAQRGMTIASIGGNPDYSLIPTDRASFENGGIHVTCTTENGTSLILDQAADPEATLEILDQGPCRVRARITFTLRDDIGAIHGSGHIDITITHGRITLSPECAVTTPGNTVTIDNAGLTFKIPGSSASVLTNGVQFLPRDEERMFAVDEKGESACTLTNVGRYPVALSWRPDAGSVSTLADTLASAPHHGHAVELLPGSAGCTIGFEARHPSDLTLSWIRDVSLTVPTDGSWRLHGFAALNVASDTGVLAGIKHAFESPLEPETSRGTYLGFDATEGCHRFRADDGHLDVVFNALAETDDRNVLMSVEGLSVNRSYHATRNYLPAIMSLHLPPGSPPHARDLTALLSVSVIRGWRSIVHIEPAPGITMAYRDNSPRETYEVWSDASDVPLFRFHLDEGVIADATLPGGTAPAFSEMPLTWYRLNAPDTPTTETRGFAIHEKGPGGLRFTYSGAAGDDTASSSTTVDIPYERSGLSIMVHTELTPHGGSGDWSSMAFGGIVPRSGGIGPDTAVESLLTLTGAGAFDTIPIAPPYAAASDSSAADQIIRPDSADGSLWILCDRANRSNILFRRGTWVPTEGALPGIEVNASTGTVITAVTNRITVASRETIEYAVEISPGTLPSPEILTRLYRTAAGGSEVRQVMLVTYSPDGVIDGFVVQ
jgi:hypothetical protein